MSAPLVVTSDRPLADELARLAAAAGVTVTVADNPTKALVNWAEASVVLVGADLAPQLAALSPARRRGVHLLSIGPVPDRTFREAVVLGVEGVAELPQSDAWLLELLAEAAEGGVTAGMTIGVIGGAGGAGATTFACALATHAGQSGDVALLDLDLLGPGVATVLGRDDLDGVRWNTLGQTTGRISARSLREALPRQDGLGVLTWAPGRRQPPPAFAVREVMSAAIRGHDTVILDLPRHPDPVAEELAARATHLLLVIRADLPGIAAGVRMAQHLRESGPVSAIVRGSVTDVADIEKAIGVPVLAAMPDQRGLAEAIDLGLGPIRSRRCVLAKAVRETLTALGGGRSSRWAA